MDDMARSLGPRKANVYTINPDYGLGIFNALHILNLRYAEHNVVKDRSVIRCQRCTAACARGESHAGGSHRLCELLGLLWRANVGKYYSVGNRV